MIQLACLMTKLFVIEVHIMAIDGASRLVHNSR